MDVNDRIKCIIFYVEMLNASSETILKNQLVFFSSSAFLKEIRLSRKQIVYD